MRLFWRSRPRSARRIRPGSWRRARRPALRAWPDVRIGADLAHGGIELVQHRLGQLGRRDQAEPGGIVHRRQAGLGEGGHVGQAGHALGPGHGQRHQAAGLRVRQRRGQVVVQHVHLAGQRVVQRRTDATVGHVHQVGARGHLEQLAHHVRDRAVAGRRIGQLAGFALGQLDEVGDVPGRDFRVDGHDVGHGGQVRDGREVLLAIERQVRVDGRVDAVRADGGDSQGIAVRRAAGNKGAADRAAGAPRFSTTTVWPSSLPSLSAYRRPTMSVVPPGGKGTIRRTGLLG